MTKESQKSQLLKLPTRDGYRTLTFVEGITCPKCKDTIRAISYHPRQVNSGIFIDCPKCGDFMLYEKEDAREFEAVYLALFNALFPKWRPRCLKP